VGGSFKSNLQEERLDGYCAKARQRSIGRLNSEELDQRTNRQPTHQSSGALARKTNCAPRVVGWT